jgi:zinc protease
VLLFIGKLSKLVALTSQMSVKFFFFSFLFFFTYNICSGQVVLPLDPEVKTGVLPNGIKYYIRKNSKPENRAELRIAINTGSNNENDDQQGLAHFTEHMAFNGTKNFPKNQLVDYLESVGTKFGPHLNAYTSFDETVYMLQVPTDKPDALEKGFMILNDWATALSFDSLEIEKERGVIMEEWRLGQGAQERMRLVYWPKLFSGSRYASRLPIGKTEVIEGFKHKVIKQYYQDWYKPEMMAVIAVGDFDPNQIEQLIVSKFGSIPASKTKIQPKIWEVPEQKGLQASVATDKENQYSMVQLIYKLPPTTLHTDTDYRDMIIRNIYTNLINSRLDEIRLQPNAPFVYGAAYYGALVKTKDSYSCYAVVKDGECEKGLDALISENERIRKFGFTTTEFERQKNSMLKEMESFYNERSKTESRSFVDEYLQYYLNGDAAPGITAEFELYKKFLPGINLSEVNALSNAWMGKDNNVMIIGLLPEKEGVKLPTEASLIEQYKISLANKIEAFVDQVSSDPLVPPALEPKPGKVTSEKKDAEFGITEWVLSNGLKVILKPTDFKNDEIIMNGFAFGGVSLAEKEELLSAVFADQIVERSGIGSMNYTQLSKYLEDKIAGVYPSISDVSQGLNGSCTPGDFETMLQLNYLYFTGIRKDTDAFNTLMTEQKVSLENRGAAPDQLFRDTVAFVMSAYNPRNEPLTLQSLEKINHDKALAFYKERFSDPSAFTYVLCGSFDPEKIKVLVEKYMGGIPVAGKNKTYLKRDYKRASGNLSRTISKGSEPRSTVSLKWNLYKEIGAKEKNEIAALVKLLSISLRENLREDKSGVYGVSVFPTIKRIPEGYYEITVSFGCAPENVELLIKAAKDEIALAQANECSEKNVQKVKEILLRERETFLKENSFWIGFISQSLLMGEPLSKLNEYNYWINSITGKDYQNWAKQYFPESQYKKFVLNPEKK